MTLFRRPAFKKREYLQGGTNREIGVVFIWEQIIFEPFLFCVKAASLNIFCVGKGPEGPEDPRKKWRVAVLMMNLLRSI